MTVARSGSDQSETFHGWVTSLVHQHRGRLVRVVRREGVRADDALDCVQEAFLSFLNLPQARLLVAMPGDSMRLLVILARNIARNRRRRHDYARPHIADDGIMEELISDTQSADDLIAAAEQRAMALGCMVTLSEVQRSVVRTRLVDEVAGEDIARQLGISPAHVAVYFFRARQKLAQCVESGEKTSASKSEPILSGPKSRRIAPNQARSSGSASGQAASAIKM